MHLVHPDRRSAGFTLLEALVALAILGILLTMGLPALDRFMHRGKIEGIARETATLMQIARFNSIKHSVPARVVVDYAADTVYAFADMNPDDGPVFDPAVDLELGRYALPAGVSFRHAADSAREMAGALENFDDGNTCTGTCPPGGWEEFRSDGSAAEPGAVRFGDERGNFLEVRVLTAATGRIEIGKWDPATAAYYPPGENGKVWEWY